MSTICMYNVAIVVVVITFVLLILWYTSTNYEQFDAVDGVTMCDYLNFDDMRMAVVIMKDGLVFNYNSGINFTALNVAGIQDVWVKGYGTITLKIKLGPNKNVINSYTNPNMIYQPIAPIQLNGTVVEIRNVCRKPVPGGWSDWTAVNKCALDIDGYCYTVKTRECNNPQPAFGGDPCYGPTTTKIHCPCTP